MDLTKLKMFIGGHKKIFLGLAILLAGAFVLQGFLRKPVQKPKETPTLVRTQAVGGNDGGDKFVYPGEVRGRYEKQLAFQVAGKVLQKNVQLGSQVNSGDILMELDARDLEEVVNSAAAQVSASASQLTVAENNLERFRELYQTSAISKAQLEQYENSFALAQSALRQADAQYNRSLNQLAYSKLEADRDGVVAGVSAEVGQVVAAGQAVVTLVQDGEREIAISVPENRLEIFRHENVIKINFWALPDVVVSGKVREISLLADTATRTFAVRISMDEVPPAVKLGMTANVLIDAEGDYGAGIKTVPSTAIMQTDDQPGVWVILEGKTFFRPVEIVSNENDSYRVRGLKDGEIIITAGVQKIRSGQEVRTETGVSE